MAVDSVHIGIGKLLKRRKTNPRSPDRGFVFVTSEVALHLGELLEERVVVLEGGFAPDAVRDVAPLLPAANLPRSCRSPPDLNRL